jgi:hypothetical protein
MQAWYLFWTFGQRRPSIKFPHDRQIYKSSFVQILYLLLEMNAIKENICNICVRNFVPNLVKVDCIVKPANSTDTFIPCVTIELLLLRLLCVVDTFPDCPLLALEELNVITNDIVIVCSTLLTKLFLNKQIRIDCCLTLDLSFRLIFRHFLCNFYMN